MLSVARDDAPTRVHNFEIAGAHTYFAGALEAWGHNAQPGRQFLPRCLCEQLFLEQVFANPSNPGADVNVELAMSPEKLDNKRLPPGSVKKRAVKRGASCGGRTKDGNLVIHFIETPAGVIGDVKLIPFK